MSNWEPTVNYRQFRLSKLSLPEYAHMKWLLFWPIFGFLFSVIERGIPFRRYISVQCSLDALIPFNELFLLPYLFWFVFLAGMLLFSFLYDTASFRRMMQFIFFTYTVTLILYMLFPNAQHLRPLVFERDNVLTRFMSFYYAMDTNTNVCPSIHVLGSVAVMLCALHSPRVTTAWRIFCVIMCILISFSTVFVKQHSIIDVFAAAILSVIGYFVVYRIKGKAQGRG